MINNPRTKEKRIKNDKEKKDKPRDTVPQGKDEENSFLSESDEDSDSEQEEIDKEKFISDLEELKKVNNKRQKGKEIEIILRDP